MKETLSENRFMDWFAAYRPNNFSYEGLQALFSHLEEYDENCGLETEFDPIAICYAFTEYNNLAEYNMEYNAVESVDEIYNHTTVIEIPDSDRFIIETF